MKMILLKMKFPNKEVNEEVEVDDDKIAWKET